MSRAEVTKITIRVGGKEHELTTDEAREVMVALQKVFSPPPVYVPPITYPVLPWRWWYPWGDTTDTPIYKLTWTSSSGDEGGHQLVDMGEVKNG